MNKIDSLANQLYAAYYGAYWNSASKHKKSLDSVISNLYKDTNKNKAKNTTPIDIDKVSKDFKKLEDFKKYGWWKE